jgi:hypothetical protein
LSADWLQLQKTQRLISSVNAFQNSLCPSCLSKRWHVYTKSYLYSLHRWYHYLRLSETQPKKWTQCFHFQIL